MEDEKAPTMIESRGSVNDTSDQGHNWGMFCHLSALLGLVWFPFGGHLLVPFGHLLGPLVIWLVKRKEYPFVDRQGKEALNFQISMTLYGILSSILVFILVGFLLLMVLAVTDVVLVIIASVKASNGESYRYPFTIRFIK
jgi:uncharacterized Tic20 family protein